MSASSVIRLPVLLSRKYPRSRSALYQVISRGLFLPPVALGRRYVARPEHEVDAVIAARAAGAGDDKISGLIAELVAVRSELSGDARTRETLQRWDGRKTGQT